MALLSTENLNQISTNVNKIGYFKIKNFLDDKTVSKVIRLFPSPKPKEETRIKIPTKWISFLIKLLKFEFKLFYIGLYLLRLKNKLNCDQIMKFAQSQNCKLVSMDLVYNSKKNELIKKWHADQLHNFNGKNKGIFKFFIYLTPTSSDNGCLAYIDKSNVLSNTIAELMFKGKLPKENIYNLDRYTKFINKTEIKDKILKTQNSNNIDLNDVIKKVTKVNDNHETKEFDIEIENSGDCLLFDETGMHRAAPTKQDRYVLRFLYQNINN